MYLEASPSSLQGTGNVSYLVPVLPTRVCRYTLDFRYKARGEGSDDVSHAPDDLLASFSTWNTSTGTGILYGTGSTWTVTWQSRRVSMSRISGRSSRCCAFIDASVTKTCCV
jgi:hypothetical protein